MLVIGGVVVLAGRRLFVPRVRATTAPIDYVALILLLVIILTGIAPTIGINLFGHGYDYRTTVAPWFRGLFAGRPDVERDRPRAVHLPGARHRRLGDLGGVAVQPARARLELPAVVPVAARTSSTAAAAPRRPPNPAPADASGARSVSRTDRAAPPEVGGGGGAREAVRTLNPGYFALVMATGIVSIAMQRPSDDAMSVVLLWLAGIGVRGAGGGVRRGGWRPSARTCWRISADPARAFGYFTFVAATEVLGARLCRRSTSHRRLGAAHGRLGRAGWHSATSCPGPRYSAVPADRCCGTPTARGSSGWSPASRSRCWPPPSSRRSAPGAASSRWSPCFSWSVAVFLYAATGIFVAARLLLYDLRPVELTPPYWVSMGATAITVVAVLASWRWRTPRWRLRRAA